MQFTGFVVGLAVTMFSVYMGRSLITPDNYPAFLSAVRTSFGLFAFLCFLEVFASLSRGRVRPKHLISNMAE